MAREGKAAGRFGRGNRKSRIEIVHRLLRLRAAVKALSQRFRIGFDYEFPGPVAAVAVFLEKKVPYAFQSNAGGH